MNFAARPGDGALVDFGLLRLTPGGTVPAWMPLSPMARATAIASRVAEWINPAEVVIAGNWAAWVWTNSMGRVTDRVTLLTEHKHYSTAGIVSIGKSHPQRHVSIGGTWCTSPELTLVQIAGHPDVDGADFKVCADLLARGVKTAALEATIAKLPPALRSFGPRARNVVAVLNAQGNDS